MNGLLSSVATLCKRSELQKEGIAFAVLEGDMKGEFLVFMEEQGNMWHFFAFYDLPEFHVRVIPKEVFLHGVNRGIVEKAEKLPNDVLEFIKYQYQMRHHGKRDLTE